MMINRTPDTPEEAEARKKFHEEIEAQGGVQSILASMGVKFTVIDANDPRVRPPRNGGCIS